MRRLLAQLTTPNARTTAFFYLGSFGINIGNYCFHLILLKFLTPASYGEFLSYISFLYLITIPAGTIFIIVTKHVSDYYGQQQWTQLSHFFYHITRKVLIPTLILVGLVMLSSSLLANLLKAQALAFIILGTSTIISFLGAIVNGYLSAFQKFMRQVSIGLTETAVKLVLAYGLISLGLGAIGGVLAMFMAGLVGVSLAFMHIKSVAKLVLFPTASGQINTHLGRTGIYSLILSAGSLSLLATDVLLVRYFFDPHTSGIYSALSVLSRMIFYGLTPLIALVLPMVTHRFARHQSTQPVLVKLGLGVVTLGTIGVLVFGTFPKLVVTILSGPEYVAASGWLVWFALGMLLLALSRLGLDYFMATNRPQTSLLLLIAMIAQPLLIGFFHQNLQQIVTVNLTIEIMLFICLLTYYLLHLKKIYLPAW